MLSITETLPSTVHETSRRCKRNINMVQTFVGIITNLKCQNLPLQKEGHTHPLWPASWPVWGYGKLAPLG